MGMKIYSPKENLAPSRKPCNGAFALYSSIALFRISRERDQSCF